MAMRLALLNVLVTLLVVGAALTAYHRLVLSPALRIGVIDVAEVVRLKEREFTELITKVGSTEGERQKALALAAEFARALPNALEELPGECDCLVLVRSAVVAHTPNTVELTGLLKGKLGIE